MKLNKIDNTPQLNPKFIFKEADKILSRVSLSVNVFSRGCASILSSFPNATSFNAARKSSRDIIGDLDLFGFSSSEFESDSSYGISIPYAIRVVTSNPFIMNNTYDSYSSSYKVSLEIVYNTNMHFKYLTHIITWLVEKNSWGNIGSNKKKDFVWKKSFVKV